jgi:dienelactone hydrolase
MGVVVMVALVFAGAGCLADGPQAKPLPPDLKALFEYDRQMPLNVVTSPPKEAAKSVEERIEFDSPLGGRVAGLLIRPSNVQRPAVILALHGLGGDKSFARLVALLLVERGYAVLGLDAALHGDRKAPGKSMFGPDLPATRQAMIQTVVDYRRAMDYLATRQDVRGDAFGLCGASMGAILGTIVAAVEQRVAAALLVVGGGDWAKIAASSQHPVAAAVRELLKQPGIVTEIGKIDPATYAPYISPRPAWFMNGRQDEIIPAEAAKALQDAAGEPKRIIWYDGGHIPPTPIMVKTMNEWLDQALAPALKSPAAEGAE